MRAIARGPSSAVRTIRPGRATAWRLFLQGRGYDVICVNPNHDSCIADAPCYPDLVSVEEPIEVVDIFRRSELVEPHVEEAIEIGAKAVWMQLGVINERAAERARDAGLKVVMDRCPRIDLR